MPRAFASIAAVALATGTARADDRSSTSDDEDTSTHLGMAAFEAAVALAIPTSYYWSTTEHQAVDWELDGSWDSWKLKLFSTEKLEFDTNPFYVNAFRHSAAGVVDYHIVRTNGFSPLTATTFAYAKSYLWEYFVEYKEPPSINDLIFNGAAGLGVGEPMYQIAQLWRGGTLSTTDRLRTAAFSPFDAFHDLYRTRTRYHRPAAWSSIEVDAGRLEHSVDGNDRGDVAGSVDIDVVSNKAYLAGGAHDGTIRTGEWSRMRLAARLGSVGDGTEVVSGQLRSQTSLFGMYHQDPDGDGRLYAVGAGFTFRKDVFGPGHDYDRLALCHLIGPQLQLSRRRDDYEVRWDLGAYVDFGLAQALVFNLDSPFPTPPPYYSSLQAHGYIDAYGVTGTTRLRAQTAGWRFDVELDGHLLRQITGHDRKDGTVERSETTTLLTADNVEERRGLWRGGLFYQPGRWGVGFVAEGVHRTSVWQAARRDVDELSFGAMVRLGQGSATSTHIGQ